MKKLITSAAALAMALGMVSASATAADLKACWVYVGAIGDFGWTYQHNQGVEAVKKEFGDKVERGRTRRCRSATAAPGEGTSRPLGRRRLRIRRGHRG